MSPGNNIINTPTALKIETACDNATGWFCQVYAEFDTEGEVDESERANGPER